LFVYSFGQFFWLISSVAIEHVVVLIWPFLKKKILFDSFCGVFGFLLDIVDEHCSCGPECALSYLLYRNAII
jgi:hypothetical protein